MQVTEKIDKTTVILPELTDKQMRVAGTVEAKVKIIADSCINHFVWSKSPGISEEDAQERLESCIRLGETSELDEKTSKLLNTILISTKERINDPYITPREFNDWMDMEFAKTGIQDVRDKFLRGLAIEPTKALVEELDKIESGETEKVEKPKPFAEFTPEQQIILNNKTKEIADKYFEFFKNKNVNLKDVKQNIERSEEEISKLDEKTSKLFEKIIVATNNHFDLIVEQNPKLAPLFNQMNATLGRMGVAAKINEMAKNFLRNLALEPTIAALKEFDQIEQENVEKAG